MGNWFATRNRIGQVHFRNVVLRKPREEYTEVFPDEGDNDMFEVMKLLVKNNYKRMIMPEHPRGLDADKALPKAGAAMSAGPTMWRIARPCCRSRCDKYAASNARHQRYTGRRN